MMRRSRIAHLSENATVILPGESQFAEVCFNQRLTMQNPLSINNLIAGKHHIQVASLAY